MRRLGIIFVAVLLVLGLSAGAVSADPTPFPDGDNGHNCGAVVGIQYLPVTMGWNGFSHLAQEAIAADEIPADRLGRQWAGFTDDNALPHANCGNNRGQSK